MNLRHRVIDDTDRGTFWIVVAAMFSVSLWVGMICSAVKHDRTIRVVVDFTSPLVSVSTAAEGNHATFKEKDKDE